MGNHEAAFRCAAIVIVLSMRYVPRTMSKLLQFFSFLRSSENVKATVRKTLAVVKNIQASVTALEIAAVQERVSKAERGDVSAQFACAEQYYFGSSVPQDYREAVRWFTRAAEQGHAQAQANLGMMYALGRGVERDYVTAYKWVSLAAVRQNASALKTQHSLVSRMTPEQLAEAQQQAAEFVVQRRSSAVVPSDRPSKNPG